ncbi:DNA polymerase [Mycobacterium intracellulare]|nr:DNA polymerase [Mycobacterium intracellulare]
MKVHEHVVAEDRVRVNVVETEEDLDGFRNFIRRNLRFLGVDSETTGLDTYAEGFRCRLVQFGTAMESWVVPVEMGGRFSEDVRRALRGVEGLVLHNASYDLQVFERCLDVPMQEMWPKVTDTRILAHLIDPRGKDEGGYGHSLEELTRVYIDAEVADNVKTLMADLAKEHKTTKANVWKKVPLNDPHYELYAGMDPILAARLSQKLTPLVPSVSQKLIPYEHKLAEVCSYMERTGFLLDVEYTEKLSKDLKLRESMAKEILQKYGAEELNVNSTDQVADVIESFGVKIVGRTASGQKRKVDDALLSDLAEGDNPQLSEFANAVIEGKKAGKWRKTWVDTFLKERDGQDRCHASINPLRARTARMSITGIPAQTLPAGDWLIRRCFLAEDGHRIASVDYQAQELRVLAALSGDQTMIQAFENDADLHQLTADAAGVDRKVGKMANFLKVYGGGAAKLATSAGITFPAAKAVIDGFDRTYPGVQKLSAKLQREATQTGYIVTPMGRRLPVDEDRAYSALNYCLDPDVPILTTNLEHRPAWQIAVGDKLIGFDETTNPGNGKGSGWRRFRTSEVEAASIVVKPSVVVRDVKGQETICSSDHLWLVRRPNKQPRFTWVRSDQLHAGDLLLSIGTWEFDTSRTAGYLAGLYDGEGSLSGRAAGRKQTSLVFSQKPGDVMDTFVESMNRLGLVHSYYPSAPNSTSPTDTVSVQGIPKILRTIGTLRPERFVKRAWEVYEGAAIIGGRQLDEIPVESIEPVGSRELVSIQTSTRTLIANGYLSHNCIQSTSRDVTCKALVRLHEAGFTPYLRLPIHDEVLCSLPEGKANWGAQRIAELMSEDMGPVHIGTDPEVGGRSWGSLYLKKEDRAGCTDPYLLNPA